MPSTTPPAQSVESAESPSDTSTQTSDLSVLYQAIDNLKREMSIERLNVSTSSPASEVRDVSAAEKGSNVTGAGMPFAGQFDEVERLLAAHNHNVSNTQGSQGQSPAMERETEDSAAGNGQSNDYAVTNVDVKCEGGGCTNGNNAVSDSASRTLSGSQCMAAIERSREYWIPFYEKCLQMGAVLPHEDAPMEDTRAKLKAFGDDLERFSESVRDLRTRWEKATVTMRGVKEMVDLSS